MGYEGPGSRHYEGLLHLLEVLVLPPTALTSRRTEWVGSMEHLETCSVQSLKPTNGLSSFSSLQEWALASVHLLFCFVLLFCNAQGLVLLRKD